MGDLERYLNNDEDYTHPLIRAPLAHVQFETIHPFLDGNGRLGRLLITLILVEAKVLHQPLLYLSLYLKQHRSAYYELLGRVRFEGDWESWVDFFIEAVITSAVQATETAQAILRLKKDDEERVATLGRTSRTALQLHNALLQRPIGTTQSLAKAANLSPSTTDARLKDLQALGLVREVTGRRRNRLFAYQAYLDILEEGTER